MNWSISYIPAAYKKLKKIPKFDAKRILSKIEKLASIQYPPDAKKLGGRFGLWRLRAGDYRVVYKPDEKLREILIIKIAHRKDVYKNL